MRVNVGSLFSGIGGMDYGLARAGHRHVFFCESDPWRREVLAARWPGAPIYEDVVALADEVDGERCSPSRSRRQGRDHSRRHASIDLLCGGFPCQDVSVAGRRRGLAGERSGLFFEFARIIQAVRPGWILVENVPGLLSSHGGRDFGVVLGTLADLGYGVAWRVLDSRFFGVPQRRRRVFIVGAVAVGDSRAAAERAGEVLAVGSRCPGHPAARGEAGPDVASTLGGSVGKGRGHDGNPFDRGGHSDDNDAQAGRLVTVSALVSRYGKGTDSDATDPIVVAAPLTKGSATGEGVNAPGHRQEDDVNIVTTSITLASDPISAHELAQPSTRRHGDPGVISNATGVRRLTPTECERLQGLPDGWTQLGDTPDSRRYSALGDAVTVTVAEWLGLRFPREGCVHAV